MEETKTFAVIRPHVVAAKSAGSIISTIESCFSIETMNLVVLDAPFLEGLYRAHQDKPFYSGLISSMMEGPSVCLVLRGWNAVERWRELIGDTDPNKAHMRTIRAKYGTRLPYNAVHGSDSDVAAEREAAIYTNFLLLRGIKQWA